MHKSAAKRARSSERKRVGNHQYLSAVRTSVKTFRAALRELADGAQIDLAKIAALFRHAQSSLGRAASKGLMKHNTVSRHTSKITAAFKKVVAAHADGTSLVTKVSKPKKASPAPKAAPKKAEPKTEKKAEAKTEKKAEAKTEKKAAPKKAEAKTAEKKTTKTAAKSKK